LEYFCLICFGGIHIVTTASAAPAKEIRTPAEDPQTRSVLDHGFVTLIDTLGGDLTVVNSARVSFGKRKTELDDKDAKLINYLAKHQHWSPFRHVQLQFHCKVPEFVARQWYKHVVGIAYTEGASIDHAWNEVSMRYVNASEFDIYVPNGFRQQSDDNKQASLNEWVDDPQGLLRQAYVDQCRKALTLYQKLVESGVAREQARGVLPLNIYTEFYWTASLQALVNFIQLRTHPGAQYEIRLFAEALQELIEPVVPMSYQALLGQAPA
jgi:thymidylate synthase (FAD)